MNLEDIKSRCEEVGECWIWKLCLQAGVPAIRIPRTIDPARPLVNVRRWWSIQQGKNVAGKLATTSCRDPRCVNPDHIVLLTRKQLQQRAGETMMKNETTARRARRAAARIGQGDTKIGPEIARQIRDSDRSSRDWAQELGCSPKTVWLARTNKTWRDLTSPFSGLMR